MVFQRRLAATGCLNADDGLGHLAGYTAMEHATAMADEVGIGAVAVGHSSHFGAAGCYALAAAERGYLGMAFWTQTPLYFCTMVPSPLRYQPHRFCSAGSG